MNKSGNINIEKIARKGSEIYEKIKSQYAMTDNGKFLAIDTDTEERFISDSSSEAVQLARAKYPNKVFYVVRIGYSAVEILSILSHIQHA